MKYHIAHQCRQNLPHDAHEEKHIKPEGSPHSLQSQPQAVVHEQGYDAEKNVAENPVPKGWRIDQS